MLLSLHKRPVGLCHSVGLSVLPVSLLLSHRCLSLCLWALLEACGVHQLVGVFRPVNRHSFLGPMRKIEKDDKEGDEDMRERRHEGDEESDEEGDEEMRKATRKAMRK